MMWKRDPQEETAETGSASPPPPPGQSGARPVRSSGATSSAGVATIGQSVVVKGELAGSEDLIIEGKVEGKIDMRQNMLTVGRGGRVAAEIAAKAVVVLGRVDGNITATERTDIRENGAVDGDITSPRVSIAEGAHFRGSIDMKKTSPAEGSRPPAASGAGGASKKRSA